MSDTIASTEPGTSAMHMSRVFDAPRKLVFEAMAKEEHLLNWFGPNDYPVVRWTHDFTPGGAFTYAMRGPDGQEAGAGGEYLEITENERIVALSRIDANGETIFEVRQTYTFEDAGGGTKLTIDAQILTNKGFPGAGGMNEGWKQTLDRLNTYLAQLTA